MRGLYILIEVILFVSIVSMMYTIPFSMILAVTLMITSGISALFNNSNLSIADAFPESVNTNNGNGTNMSANTSNSISVNDYDRIKNCSADRNKQPTSIEYLTYFNCGRVSTTNNDQTVMKDFTLIVEENHSVPISYEGHEMDAWTFNGTIPGPTMRMTEGDLVKITVINSKDSKHPHSLHMHSIHSGAMDGVQGAGGAIAPGQSFTYEFVANLTTLLSRNMLGQIAENP